MNPTCKYSTDLGSTSDLNNMIQEHEIDILSTPGRRCISKPGSTNDQLNIMSQVDDVNSPSPSHPKKFPCVNLLHGSREEYIEICLPLYEASITSDWKSAKIILDERPELVRFAITQEYGTALHVAALAEGTKLSEDFMQNLVNMMEKEDLELENQAGHALIVAAAGGSTKMAQILLNKHNRLLTISNGERGLPLTVSASCGNHEMARYLYDASEKMAGAFWGYHRAMVFCNCVAADMFDIALEILLDYPEIITEGDTCRYVLHVLARKPDALNRTERSTNWKVIDTISAIAHMKKEASEKDYHVLNLLKGILEITIKVPCLNIDDMLRGPVNEDGYPCKGLFVAAEMGNTRFVIELIRAYPHLLMWVNKHHQTIFHIAVMHRHEGIYNLLYEIGSKKFVLVSQRDERDNTVLHLLGKTSNKMQLQTVSGASLLMQRELLWFKEVERMMPPYMRELKNKDGLTPYELFSKNNKDFVSQGLKRMRDCMVVATLIVTVAFAVAFTVPRGYNQETGIPIFIHERTFLVFVIADAVSLFSSSTSLLVFLSILTSRYGQRDFLYSLPKKLMIGLVTLFISVAAMMVTFSASFFVLYHNRLKWVPILISIFAATPMILFAALQFPLLIDMFRSMYDSRYIFNPKKPTLYKKP